MCYILAQLVYTLAKLNFKQIDILMLSVLLYILCTIAFLPEAFNRKNEQKKIALSHPHRKHAFDCTPRPLVGSGSCSSWIR